MSDKGSINNITLPVYKKLKKETVARYDVTNIEELSDAQLDNLRCGDSVQKITGLQKHNYIVTYKQEKHGICLSYYAAGYLETISYDYVDGHWVFNSKDVTIVGESSIQNGLPILSINSNTTPKNIIDFLGNLYEEPASSDSKRFSLYGSVSYGSIVIGIVDFYVSNYGSLSFKITCYGFDVDQHTIKKVGTSNDINTAFTFTTSYEENSASTLYYCQTSNGDFIYSSKNANITNLSELLTQLTTDGHTSSSNLCKVIPIGKWNFATSSPHFSAVSSIFKNAGGKLYGYYNGATMTIDNNALKTTNYSGDSILETGFVITKIG